MLEKRVDLIRTYIIMIFSNEIVKKSAKVMAKNEKPILTDDFVSNRRF